MRTATCDALTTGICDRPLDEHVVLGPQSFTPAGA
jgi:hypothetical protein